MGRLADVPPNVRTTYLGQYPGDEANRIAGELEERGIVWWYKQPGTFTSIWEYGVRLFVDRTRLDEAREIAKRIDRERQASRGSTGTSAPAPASEPEEPEPEPTDG